MKFFLTGGTGFVGSYLTKQLVAQGHQVTILSRRPQRRPGLPAAVTLAAGDPTQPGDWQQLPPQHEVIINLAGASVFGRWTAAKKKEIYDSRILTTRNLVQALRQARERQTQVLFSTSAIGYYGDRGEEELTETSPPGDDFLARVARDWEAEALAAQDLGLRVVITRFGLVIGDRGGILEQLVPLFKAFLGGPLGSGRQWFSWIDQSDQLAAFLFVLSRPDLEGVINFVSPNPVRNADFVRALAQVLNRPAVLPTPAWAVKLALGEFATVVLGGQKVLPTRLLAAGFNFAYPEITAALRHHLLESGDRS